MTNYISDKWDNCRDTDPGTRCTCDFCNRTFDTEVEDFERLSSGEMACIKCYLTLNLGSV